MPRPIIYPNVFGTLSGTVSASLLDQNWQVTASVVNDSAAGWVNAAVDTGSTNNYVVTLNPAPSAYLNGFFLSMSPLNSNTGPSSINVNGLGNIQLLTSDGSALGPQFINPGTIYSMVCYNNAMRIISPAGSNMVGEVKLFAGSSWPSNWMVCNGQALSRTTYQALFKVVGTVFGAGDGATTFNIPNMLGRFPMHNTAGTSGGVSSVALGTPNLPPHSHGVNDPGHAHGVSDPGHTHGYVTIASGLTGIATGGGIVAAGGTTNPAVTGIGIQGAGTGISIQATGSGSAFSVQNPYLTLIFIIRLF